jgi:leucyl aminopeptidase (aminopeptidase T)
MNLNKAAKVIVNTCLGIEKNERLLVLTDSKKLDIAEIILDESTEVAKYSKLLEKEIGVRDGEEPSKVIAKEMLNYDVIIAPTTHSISHTNARINACKKGIRVATMPGITKEMMNRCINLDYNKMSKLIDNLRDVIKNGNEMNITTKLGTDLSFLFKGRLIHGDKGIITEEGDFGNLPAGEVDFAPLEKSSNGVYIVDGSHAGLGKVSNLKFEVKKGFAKRITGYNSDKLIKLLNSVKNKNAYNIAELGIGTNSKAKITGDILEDEKIKGTCHLALGNNKTYGGKVNVPIHLDGVIKNPSIFVDDEEIMRKGKFKL